MSYLPSELCARASQSLVSINKAISTSLSPTLDTSFPHLPYGTSGAFTGQTHEDTIPWTTVINDSTLHSKSGVFKWMSAHLA